MTRDRESSRRREIADEARFHTDMRTRELTESGFDPASARRQAEAEAADPRRLESVCVPLARQRDRRGWWAGLSMGLGLDLRLAWRRILTRPAAGVAVLTMALGIGAATAIYSVVDSVLLRPLPFPDPDRLVSVWLTDDRWRTDSVLSTMWDSVPVGRVEYDPMQGRTPSIAAVGLWADGAAMLGDAGGRVERVNTARVTASIFDVLGVRPARGRLIRAGEDVLNGPAVAILSWEAWQHRFGGDEGVVGRTVLLDEKPHEVVGVLPAGVRLSRSEPPPAVWTPALQQVYDLPENRNRSYHAIARLAPGASVESAGREASAVFRSLGSDQLGARVEPWQQDETRSIRASLVMLAGAVGLLLTIACVNVAMVTVAEAATRARELASRVAVGASRARLFRQLLGESLTQALLAAPIGGLLAWAGVSTLVALAPAGVPGLADAALDRRALTFAAALILLTGVAVGIAPALLFTRAIAVSPRHTARGAGRVQRWLVGIEVALAFVMLVGCGFLGHSLLKLRDVPVGFVPEGLSVVRIAATRTFWRDDARSSRYFRDAAAAIGSLPGVTHVAPASSVPFGGGHSSSPIQVEGGDGSNRSTQQFRVGAGYFEVTGTPIVAGRAFDERDVAGADTAVVVSATAARRDFGDASPLGRRVRWQGQWRTIIGVAGDVRVSRLSRQPTPTIYAPETQAPGAAANRWTQLLVVRASAATPALAAAIRERAAAIDRAVVVQAVDELPALIAASYAEESYRATLVTVFGIFAGLLAAVGVFAVAARSMASREREAGIRVALGASASSMIRAMTRDVAAGIAGGLTLGAAASAVLARWLAPQLFDVGASDPIVFGGATLLVGVTVAIALLPPLRRAIRVDPVVALRSE